MSLIYVVVESGGEYEDKWKQNIAAYPTREAAEAAAEAGAAAGKLFRERSETLKEWLQQYRTDHPYQYYAVNKPYPRWQPGLGKGDITPAMQAERDKIIRENEESRQKFLEEVNRWNAEHLPVVNAKRVELGLPEVDHMVRADPGWIEESWFSVDEVPFFGGYNDRS